MRFLLLFIISFNLLTETAHAKSIRATDLENRLKNLESVVRSMEIEIRNLRFQLAAIKTANPHEEMQCPAKEEYLEAQLTELKQMGINATHPDAMKLAKDLEAARAECKANEAEVDILESDCATNIKDLVTKRERLRTMGYMPSHPDIIALTSAINDLSASCPIT